ncbi:MAG: hypothetical protein MUF74_13895 [Cypionkella sp.]|nr:hypothetical protein [Cypionkella sp.]
MRQLPFLGIDQGRQKPRLTRQEINPHLAADQQQPIREQATRFPLARPFRGQRRITMAAHTFGHPVDGGANFDRPAGFLQIDIDPVFIAHRPVFRARTHRQDDDPDPPVPRPQIAGKVQTAAPRQVHIQQHNVRGGAALLKGLDRGEAFGKVICRPQILDQHILQIDIILDHSRVQSCIGSHAVTLTLFCPRTSHLQPPPKSFNNCRTI